MAYFRLAQVKARFEETVEKATHAGQATDGPRHLNGTSFSGAVHIC